MIFYGFFYEGYLYMGPADRRTSVKLSPIFRNYNNEKVIGVMFYFLENNRSNGAYIVIPFEKLR